jgi:hypothetical protein
VITTIVTGGQSGADQAGWRAARSLGIACAGWMPPDFATEGGPRPEFASLYGAQALAIDDYRDLFGQVDWKAAYRDRTFLNAEMADACVWFGNPSTPGGWCTQRACMKANIDYNVIVEPRRHADDGDPPLSEWLANYTSAEAVRTLFVAGNRESKSPGIGAWVESYLAEVFRSILAGGATS